MKKALFAGSFDPFTVGHYALVNRALKLKLADKIIIAIGVNAEKKAYIPLNERINSIKHLYSRDEHIEVTSYQSLTVDFARLQGVSFIIRGIRNINDFEHEKQIAEINRQLSGIETVFLISEPEYQHISSSFIRELINFNQDISQFIPHI